MGQAKVKVEALLLVVVMLASCFAPSFSATRCIPRRLLAVAASRYQEPCNEERIDRGRATPVADSPQGREAVAGSRRPKGPQPPVGRTMTAMSAPRNIPGNNN
ncbi:hypothetical protein BRADI_3g11240v3 [Brachypodium distachyon]|uniref:Uncharacterized protein n=1 Tax=Brachypodium distachyon TaxID=15368 RepID=I1HZV6_BRADI|nr:hypothetical protein BRADI_3g11240v3 [Brachypodium distachyon]